MLNSGADKKRDARAAKSRERRGKGKGAGAALGRILFGEPEGVDGEVCAAQAEEEQADEKPREAPRVPGRRLCRR